MSLPTCSVGRWISSHATLSTTDCVSRFSPTPYIPMRRELLLLGEMVEAADQAHASSTWRSCPRRRPTCCPNFAEQLRSVLQVLEASDET